MATSARDVNTNDPRNLQAHVTYTSFDELREIINEYLDDFLPRSEFHRFRQLPLELRQDIYAQYLLGKEKCKFRHWPQIELGDITMQLEPRFAWGNELEPFFPSIFLVDHKTGLEAAVFMIQTATFVFTEPGGWDNQHIPNSTVEPFLTMLKRLGGISLLQEVRRAVLPDTGIFITVFPRWNDKLVLNVDRSLSIPTMCSQLQEFTFAMIFSESLELDDTVRRYYNPGHEHISRHYVQLIPFHVFNNCDRLRKVVVRGIWDRMWCSNRSMEVQDERREMLVDVGRRLKKEHATRGLDIEVRLFEDEPYSKAELKEIEWST
ncbi:hypothetical protein BDV96DRAFT_574502 [Lophiotrema nucula]|uniref:Uncharacterized protein n=1 Tax=Lophiotrema nucula TaxID=690887 RepID=A0A6A5ZBJ3_9PLEO|nr:hypothetical protein BDV96DRAFT_574502 [Lophiotrema nucula]